MQDAYLSQCMYQNVYLSRLTVRAFSVLTCILKSVHGDQKGMQHYDIR